MPLLNLAPMFRLYETYPTGAPLVGGKLYTAQPGTVAGPTQSFPKSTFTDATGGVANTNPVIFDGSGKADVWLNGDYSVALYDINGLLISSSPDVTGSSASVANGTDQISFYDATLATVNVSIPSATDPTAGPQLIFKTDSGANHVVITPVTGTIDGLASYDLANQNEWVRLVPQTSSNDWKRAS